MIHLTSLNLFEKQLWEAPTLEEFIAKTNRIKALKYTRNTHIHTHTHTHTHTQFTADCVKKKGNGFLIILIHLLLLTIIQSFKR